MKLIYERLEKLGSDMFISNYSGDIVNLLVNKPKAYRFLYDAQADLYMICDAWNYIHADMIKKAFEEGWYIDQEYFCKAFTEGYSWKSYYNTGINVTKLDGVDREMIDLISDNVYKDDSFLYPWIFSFAFTPYENDEKFAEEMYYNGCNYRYVFSYGCVYSPVELDCCDEMETALNRADR